jgi:probable rRNA maturation factor
MAIHFFFADTRISLRDRTRLKAFITTMFGKEGKKLSGLNYVFCSDEYLLDINRRFLNHDYYTDIITFDISEKRAPIEGEIYISIDRVKENALSMNQSFRRELHRVIFHGVLHLCGYKDKSKADEAQMRAKENEYLDRYL